MRLQNFQPIISQAKCNNQSSFKLIRVKSVYKNKTHQMQFHITRIESQPYELFINYTHALST